MLLNHFFTSQVLKNFPFTPTNDQEVALNHISEFLLLPSQDTIFLLKGYAGTGKSTLIGTLVQTMTELGQKTVLLAPTGRAAKIFGHYSHHTAFTIHKKIYRQKRFSNETNNFVPADNLHKDTLFIVDEASMINNGGGDSHYSEGGNVLEDLIHYVYAGENCKLLLIGDDAQLPPVMQKQSPALQPDTLRSFGLDVQFSILTQIVRQAEDSGILFNATEIRKLLKDNSLKLFPKLYTHNFEDIKLVSGEELIDEISSAYDKDGIEETMIISRSNKRANIYNNGVRNRILYREEELSSGDVLIVSKNNYYWTKEVEAIDFLANGELLEVIRVRKEQELYGFKFCDILVRHPDYDIELEIKVLLDTLHTDATNLPQDKTAELFYNILEDYPEINTKNDKLQKIKNDPFFNAVQIKYGYAITCHKAQGGEWKNVFLDVGYLMEELMGENFYRWLYTAITRASNQLYLVNLPKELIH